MKFTDITLADVSVETKVETLGVVLDQKLSEIDSQVSTVTKLVGPQGPKGDKGDKGAQGVAGIDGKAGKDGRDGKDGKDGKDGDDGKTGVSVIGASVDLDGSLVLELSNGNQIDAGEVVGPAGPGGMNGPTGPQGLQGPQGEQGIQGPTGTTGATGPQGIQGIQGETGPAGVGVVAGGTTGQVLAKIDATDYNTQWITPSAGGSGTVTSVAASAGTGISVTGSPITTSGTLTITNTAPDQVVAFTNGTGISVTGTYPNFTVTNTSPSSGGTVTSVTGTAPVVSSGGNTPAISMAKATSLVDGYLSATDWTTFNSKQPAGTYATGTGTASGTNTGDETTATIKTKLGVASTSTDGYLTSTDWNSFNSKGSGTVTSVAALTLGTTGTDLSSTVATGTTTPVITLNVPTASATNRGALSAADWTTFNGKGNGTVTSVGGTGTVSGLTLTGTVTSTGNLTLGGTLSATASNISDFSTAADARIAVASIHALSDVTITSPTTNQVLTYNGTGWINQASAGGSFTGGTLTSPLLLAAGTATNATEPLKMQSGPVTASPAAGTFEYDGVTIFNTPQAGNRGVVPSVHYITQTATYTTPTGTANTLKQMFNATTNGTLTVSGNTTYFFECLFYVTAMSATSGTLQFGIGGTAAFTNILYMSIANKTATSVQTASSHTLGTVKTATVITAANTTTTGYAHIKGKFIVTTGGTIIPSFALSTAAAAIVQPGSFFKCYEVGNNTEVEIGAWT